MNGDPMIKVRFGLPAACIAAAMLAGAAASAQQATRWPERPIRFIVPFQPGSSSDTVARIVASLLRPLSENFANASSERIHEFSHGFSIISTLSEFLSALGISVGMWLVVAIMYLETIHSFRATPSLANLSFAATMLLLATSLGGSLFQLPILGWFTQIALIAAALHGFFNVPLESATACAAALLFTANLAVIPGGFIAAQVEGITLREAATAPGA